MVMNGVIFLGPKYLISKSIDEAACHLPSPWFTDPFHHKSGNTCNREAGWGSPPSVVLSPSNKL